MRNLFFSLMLLLCASCGKFLEPQSQTEYIPRDLNSLNELLLGNAYIDPATTSAPIFSLNEIFSDDWGVTDVNGNNTSNLSKYTLYKPLYAWHPQLFKLSFDNNVSFYNVWKTTYQNILGCNAVLDYVDKMQGATVDRNYVKGQALALRAFFYFQLVNLFGEPYNYNKQALGVPLKLNSNLELEYPKRATVDEVYKQMDNDLSKAEQCYLALPQNKQFIKDGRITLPMIQLMKARLALFKEDYPQVVINSKKVIEDWGLSLLDLNTFTSTTAQPYYLFSNYKNPEALWLFGCSFDFNRYTTESIYSSTPITTANTRRMFAASNSLLNSFATNDLRKANYILKESATYSNLIPAGKIPMASNFSAITTEFGKALRLSEAYMMLSEAYYHTGQQPQAVILLETLRKVRFKNTSGDEYKVPANSTSGTALLTFIKEERRRELCFEALRWFDQRRYGMESFKRIWKEEGLVTEFTMEKNDPAFTLPIPFDAMEKNPNLEQNKLSNPKY